MILTIVVSATPVPVDGKVSFGIETRRTVRGSFARVARAARWRENK
jgi:hypothetical protein